MVSLFHQWSSCIHPSGWNNSGSSLWERLYVFVRTLTLWRPFSCASLVNNQIHGRCVISCHVFFCMTNWREKKWCESLTLRELTNKLHFLWYERGSMRTATASSVWRYHTGNKALHIFYCKQNIPCAAPFDLQLINASWRNSCIDLAVVSGTFSLLLWLPVGHSSYQLPLQLETKTKWINPGTCWPLHCCCRLLLDSTWITGLLIFRDTSPLFELRSLLQQRLDNQHFCWCFLGVFVHTWNKRRREN